MTRVFKNGLAFSTTTPHLPTQDYQGQPPLMDSDHHTTRAPPLRRSTRIRNVRYDILSLSVHQSVHFLWYPALPQSFVWEEKKENAPPDALQCYAWAGLGSSPSPFINDLQKEVNRLRTRGFPIPSPSVPTRNQSNCS